MVKFKETLKDKLKQIESSNPCLRKTGEYKIGGRALDNYGSGYIDYLDKNKGKIIITATASVGIGLTLTNYLEHVDRILINNPGIAESLRRGVMETFEYAGKTYDKIDFGWLPHLNIVKDPCGQPVIINPGPDKVLNIFQKTAVSLRDWYVGKAVPFVPWVVYSIKGLYEHKKKK